MHLLRSLRRRFRGRDIDWDTRVAAEAEGKKLAADRDTIRGSQGDGIANAGYGLMTATPDVLHPHEDERR
jgi:hypothetical protein